MKLLVEWNLQKVTLSMTMLSLKDNHIYQLYIYMRPAWDLKFQSLNSTSIQVESDKEVSWTTTPTLHHLNFLGTSRQLRELIFGMQPYFDPNRKTTSIGASGNSSSFTSIVLQKVNNYY
jgi:hypothetical protein